MRCCCCSLEPKTAPKQKKGGGDKLPKNWKEHWQTKLPYCAKCWRERYTMTAVRLSIVGPPDKEDWPEVRRILRLAWGEARRLANWVQAELFATEDFSKPREEKLPKHAKPYLYKDARKVCPELGSASVARIVHAEEGKYSARRFDLIHMGSASLASARFPRPLPLDPGAFKLSKDEHGRLMISAKLLSNEPRVDLVIGGGINQKYQLTGLNNILAGNWNLVEGTIYQVAARPSDHRGGADAGRAGKPYSRIMLKLTAWRPKRDKKERTSERFFSLKTDKDTFLYGILQDREDPWVINADQARHWSYQHARDIRRLSEDRKAETRQPRSRRRRQKDTLEVKSRKYYNRMKTFVDTSAAQIVNFATRSGVARISYDDTERNYFAGQEASFQWAVFKEKIRQKCDDAGITFVAVGDEEDGKKRRKKPKTPPTPEAVEI